MTRTSLDILPQIKEKAKSLFPEIQGIRHHLHQHPELSFKEVETSKYLCHQLDKHGIPYQAGWVKTGIVATITGELAGDQVILLRADMDALPIQEQNEKSYCSKNKGIMHACGHDVHSACTLGAAIILNSLRSHFGGTIKIMFQPGEELLPGGASLMIKEGVLKNPDVSSALAQHVFPSMETGKVGFRKGMYMASTDEIYLTIQGKGGHAAMPADYNNPLLISAKILTALEKAFSIDSIKQDHGHTIPTVLAFGKIIGEGATNVIPERVKLDGTFRTMDEKWRAMAHQLIRNIVEKICEENKATFELQICHGYPYLVNHPELTEKAMNWAKTYLGAENVEELPLRMTAEDFAFISQEIPSCFYRLGTGNAAQGITSGVHTSTFDIDERALEIGTGLMAWLTFQQLKEESN